MARCENCLHYHLCVNMESQHLRMLLVGDKADKRCRYFESAANVAPIADTVRKMQERLKAHFDTYTDEDETNALYMRNVIDQIAKEMIEGEK